MNIGLITFGEENYYLAYWLCESLKITNPDLHIIQVSNENKKLTNVNELIFVKNKKKFLLFEKIEYQIIILKEFGPCLFLDCDMLVNTSLKNIINLLNQNKLILTKRSDIKKYINPNFTINKKNLYFRELDGKTFGDMMPYNGGFVACKDLEIMTEIKQIYSKLSENMKIWYGDQVALKLFADKNKDHINILDSNEYNYTPLNISDYDKHKTIYHFKGNKKKLIKEFYKKNIYQILQD